MLPLSLNNQLGRPGSGKRTYLKPQVDVFRREVWAAIGSRAPSWKQAGVGAAIIIFEDPKWTTKRLTVRRKDADNLVKPTLDAIERATDHQDEFYWQVHFFKILSKHTKTTAFLFDLGDIVDYYR